MRFSAFLSGLAAAAVGTSAYAGVKVATDIAPVHSLVSQLIVNVPDSEVSLVMPQNASPHHHSLRPSEVRTLSSADLVVWVGPTLTPWLESAVERIAEGNVVSMPLEAVEGTLILKGREGGFFKLADDHDDHDHDHAGHDDHDDHDHAGHDDHDDHDDHDHAGHDDHDHDHDHADHSDHAEHAGHDDDGAHEDHSDHAEHAGHDGHDHEDHSDHAEHAGHDDHDHADHGEHDDHDDHEGHAHSHAGGIDPHMWLDPDNAIVWLDAIAHELAKIDPENAKTYLANASTAQAALLNKEEALAAQIAPYRDRPIMAFHDAYQYFEYRFKLPVLGSVTLGDAQKPGAARIAELRHGLEENDVRCIFTEPQFEPRLAQTLIEGTDIKIDEMDPIGAALPLGPDFYGTLLDNMAQSFVGCVK